jgi:TrmH family RNA methyltransferase
MEQLRKASQKQLTHIRSLAKRRNRRDHGHFIAEGSRTVQQIIAQKRVNVLEIFITEEYLHEFGKPLFSEKLYLMQAKDLNSIADTETQQGILAVCEIPESTEITYWDKPEGFLIALDQLQDPGNLGTLIRTASWFGFKGILCSVGTVDQWNSKVVRSTVGATGYLPYAEGDLDELLHRMQEMGWHIMLLDAHEHSISLHEWDPEPGTILVVGNEANGISAQLLEQYPRLRIDGAEKQAAAESLNASVAGAIVMHYAFSKVKR